LPRATAGRADNAPLSIGGYSRRVEPVCAVTDEGLLRMQCY